MMTPENKLILIGFLVSLLVTIVVLTWLYFDELKDKRADQLRTLEMRELAMRLKFDSFRAEPDRELVQTWDDFFRSVMPKSAAYPYAFNVLRGHYFGQPLFIFDFQYRLGARGGTISQTFFVLVEKKTFPQLLIFNCESSKAETLFFADQIHFESIDFSQHFHVHSTDKKFAYDVCTPQMIEYLLANKAENIEIRIQGPLIVLEFEPRVPVNRIEFNLNRLTQIRSLMPDYLFTQNA